MKIKLRFLLDVYNDNGIEERSDEVVREFRLLDNQSDFLSRVESFFNELLFQYVPGYPLHKAPKITRLDVKPTDWVIIEHEFGAIEQQCVEEIAKRLCKVVSRCEVVALRPGRGELKFTVIGKEKEL